MTKNEIMNDWYMGVYVGYWSEVSFSALFLWGFLQVALDLFQVFEDLVVVELLCVYLLREGNHVHSLSKEVVIERLL